MPVNQVEFLQIDLPALLALAFATLSCGLSGNFLVLQKRSMLADSLAHSVLPGIVAGFTIIGTRHLLSLFAGALLSALVAAFLIDFFSKYSKDDSNTIMGVVYTTFFALGIFGIEQSAAKNVDLDLDCVLFGQLEHILWLTPTSFADLWSPYRLLTLPREVLTLAGLFIAILALILFFYKELKMMSFDPEWAKSQGMHPMVFRYGITFLVTCSIIASFEALGSIVVIALVICPATIARLFCNRFSMQLITTLGLSLIMSTVGYFAATYLPLMLGFDHALSAGGAVASLNGIVFIAACVLIKILSRYKSRGRGYC